MGTAGETKMREELFQDEVGRGRRVMSAKRREARRPRLCKGHATYALVTSSIGSEQLIATRRRVHARLQHRLPALRLALLYPKSAAPYAHVEGSGELRYKSRAVSLFN